MLKEAKRIPEEILGKVSIAVSVWLSTVVLYNVMISIKLFCLDKVILLFSIHTISLSFSCAELKGNHTLTRHGSRQVSCLFLFD